MAISTSLAPLADSGFGYTQAQHLLNRAGFGGTPRQIAALQKMGVAKAVDLIVDYQSVSDADLAKPDIDPDLIRPPTPEERQAMQKARQENDENAIQAYRNEQNRREFADRGQLKSLQKWWLARMVESPRPLEEKMTLLWHGHFASNYRTVRDTYLMLEQNQLFRKNACGNFADLAYGIIRDPAMIRFLDNNTNRRAHPNENLARELMELFTLGVSNYTENDIKEGARALTGYTFADNDFAYQRFNHDEGSKVLLGSRGNYTGEDFIKLILSKPACHHFVAYKLYRHFAGDIDDPKKLTPEQDKVIESMSMELGNQKYELRPVLKKLFTSEHFYDPAVMGGMIKSPVQCVVGTVRMLGTPVRDLGVLNDALSMMGQELFNPPSVAGWDGGRGWMNTSTLFCRQNTAAFLVSGKLPFDDGWSQKMIDYDPMFLVQDLTDRSPEAVVDHMMATLLGNQVLPKRREQLVAFLTGNELKPDAMIGLLLLVTAMPEYQLC